MTSLDLTPMIRMAPLASAATSVADALGQHILDALRPGAQLPSEAELATTYGVSRITIREALKILAGRGLVGLSRGKRAVVTQPDGAMFGAFLQSLIKSDPRCMFDLLQVRRTLEIQSVTLACRHASRSGLAAIEAALGGMRDAAMSIAAGVPEAKAQTAFDIADVQFHEAVALAGGNRVLTYLFEAMESSLLEAFIASHSGHRNVGASLRSGYESHNLIFQHVCARDEKAATDAMLELLAAAEANLRAAYGGAV